MPNIELEFCRFVLL